MRLFFMLLCFLGLSQLASAQCPVWHFPNDKSMYEINVCVADSAFPFDVQLDKPSVIHNEVTYIMQDETFFEGPDLWIDFDDGLGFQQLPANGIYTTTYASPGTKFVTHCWDINGPNCFELFRLEVKSPGHTYSPPDDIYYLGAGRAYVSLGAGNEEITKPIIFVEGLDLGTQVIRDPNYNNEIIRWGDRGWDVFTMGMEEVQIVGDEVLENAPDQIADFIAEGYDFILLDFAEGAGDIQGNAEVLKELINKVNNDKVADANGVTHENIVIGASMGAIIARIALAQMEDDGEGHCTGTYVSFDGPHKGANIPLGMQSLIWHAARFPNEDASDYDKSKAVQTWEALKKPAPQQLLCHNLLGAEQQGLISLRAGENDLEDDLSDFEDMSIDFTAARQSLVSLLEEVGYPEQTRNLAIVNGNGNGQNVGFSEGAHLLDADAWEGSIAGMVFRMYMNAYNGAPIEIEDFSPNTIMDKGIFYAKTPLTSNFIGVPNNCGYTAVEMLTNLPSFDNAPGSLREDMKNLVIPTLNDLPVIGDNNDGNCSDCDGVVNWHVDHSSFVSTVSGLDLNTNNLFFNVSSLDYDNPDPDMTPFSKIYVPDSPELHGHANAGNRAWINNQLSQNTPDLAIEGVLPNTNGDTYNYGYYRNKIPTVVVKEGGYLRVNNEGPTAYLNEPISNNETFEAYTSSCDGSDITVNNGGHFIIGKNFSNPTRRGYVYFTDGSTLTLKGGAEALVEQQSHLVFQEGSEAVIEADGLLTAKFGAQVIIESGATLRVQTGGKLRIMHFSDLIVEDGGQLILDEGAIVQLWDNSNHAANIQVKGELVVNGDFVFSGSGYFTFFSTHDLTFGPNAGGLTLDGAGKGTRFIELQNTDLDVGGLALRLTNGKVDYVGTSRLKIGSGGSLIVDDMEFTAIGSGVGQATAVTAENADVIDIYDSDFYDFSFGLFSSGLENPGALQRFRNSSMTNCTNGAWIYALQRFTFFNSQFNAGSNGSNAIWALEVDDISSWGDAINGYPIGNSSPDYAGAIILHDVQSFRMEHGNISDNDVGIVTPEGFRSNIFLSKGTRVENNGIGINMVKGGIDFDGQDYGLVHADCAKFINNTEVAIKGVDVLLEIDAVENCLGCFPFQVRHNVFVGENLFEICYQDRDVTQVGARGNYWGGDPDAPYPNQYLFTNAGIGAGCNSVWNTVELDSKDAELMEPTGNCNGGEYVEEFVGPEDKMCVLKIEGVNYLLHQQFLEAYEDFRIEAFELSSSKYAPIAAVPDNIRIQSSNVCKRYIDVARVMAYVNDPASSEPLGLSGGIKSDNYMNQWSSKAVENSSPADSTIDFEIYPNPASDNITIGLSPGNYEIRLLNALGELQHTVVAGGQTKIDVSDWPKGIYLVAVTDLETNFEQTSKLIIQ